MMMKIIVGLLAGLAFGSMVGYVNYRISGWYLKKRRSGGGQGEMASAMCVNLARMVIDAGALGAVLLMRALLPWPYAAVMAGTAVGMSAVSTLLLLRLSRREEQG